MKRATPFLLVTPALLVLGLFAVSLVSFIGISFLRQDPGGASFGGPLTLDNYAKAIGSEYARHVALQTFMLAVKVTALAVVLGFPLAYVLARSPSRLVRNTILFGLVATFLSGGVTRAYAWMLILGNKGVVNSILSSLGLSTLPLINNEFAVIVSVLNFSMPFFVLTLFGTLQAIPVSLEHAARNLGASRTRVFLEVTWPLALPGLVAASSLVFAIGLAAFLFPELLGGGKVHVSATSIYQKIQTDYDLPSAAALSVLFLALTAVVFTAFTLVQRGFARRAEKRLQAAPESLPQAQPA
jgi:putative spermidine/putrescine transport system permease protein